ncbi:MAG TPA: hypothetical protein VN325_06965, partial [Steroidobacteraceae bacterium]|nr:hypothetical protein [Steroidobacteraceae bacterium]
SFFSALFAQRNLHSQKMTRDIRGADATSRRCRVVGELWEGIGEGHNSTALMCVEYYQRDLTQVTRSYSGKPGM